MADAQTLREINERIMRDPRYIEGVAYGLPRKGHEEGSVANHIVELRQNLGKLSGYLTSEEYFKLLILIHVHDTFKCAGKRLSDNHQVSLRDPRSHAMLARKFLSEFTDDESILAIAQWHDEGHGLWRQVEKKGRYNEARLKEALQHIPDLELYLLFTVIDGHTASKRKERSPKWFLDVVYNHCAPQKRYRAYSALALLEASNLHKVEGTGKEEDRDVVIVLPDPQAMFGRRMYEKHTGKEIPFGTYPNIDWS